MEIREATDRGDFRAIVRVNARAWRAAYDHIVAEPVLADLSPDPAPETVETAMAAARERAGTVLVAAVDGEVVGFAETVRGPERTGFVPDGAAELRTLYVDPDHWREGVGTTLLAAARERAAEHVEELWLQAFEANERGRSFYEARGFEAAGTTTFEVRGTEHPTTVYRCALAAHDADQPVDAAAGRRDDQPARER